MSPIRRVIRQAALRIALQRALASLIVTITAGAIALLIVRVLERGGVLAPDWNTLFIVSGAGVFLAAIAWTLIRMPSREGVALIVDESAGLKDALSTALSIENAEDAWSRAAVAHAVRTARGVSLKRSMPFSAPRAWPAPIAALALFLLAGLLPTFDLLGEAKASEDRTQTTREIESARAEVSEIESKVNETLKKLEDRDLEAEFDAEEAQAKKPESPEQIRRQALAKLTRMKDKLNEMREQQDGSSMDALKQRLRTLEQGDAGPLDEFTKAIQKGDFEGAKNALQDLKQKLASGELTESQKAKLAEQMKSLSEQLAQLAKQKDELKKALKEAGMDPSLAADPDALQQAIQNNPNLSAAQKQSLQKMAQSTQSACSKCNSMASAAASMAKAGGESLSASEMAAMEGQLSDLASKEGALADMDSAMKAFEELTSSLSQSMGQCEGSKYDPFARPQPGQRGLGAGDPYSQKSDFALNQEKSDGRTSEGPIIGSTFIEGGKIRGESTEAFSGAVQSSGQAAAQAIEEKLIPVEYHDAIKNYFGRLDSAAKSNATDPAKPNQN